jgi:hypothetical protein
MKKLMYLLLATFLIVGLASCNEQNHGHKITKKPGGKQGGKRSKPNDCNCPTWD